MEQVDGTATTVLQVRDTSCHDDRERNSCTVDQGVTYMYSNIINMVLRCGGMVLGHDGMVLGQWYEIEM